MKSINSENQTGLNGYVVNRIRIGSKVGGFSRSIGSDDADSPRDVAFAGFDNKKNVFIPPKTAKKLAWLGCSSFDKR